MRILALDLGTTTGWAIRDPGGSILSGSQSFKPGRWDGGGMRFLRFRRWLDEIKGGGNIDLLVYEEVRRHLGLDASHVYGGFMGHVTEWCEERNIPYYGEPVKTIKRAATGKGNADKQAMIDADKALGFDPEDDNEADAIHLLLLTAKQYCAPPKP